MVTERRLVSFPVQVVEEEGGVLLLRGIRRLRIAGEGAVEAVRIVFSETSGEGTALDDLLDLFPGAGRAAAEQLISRLLDVSFLVTSDGVLLPPTHRLETEEEVFYWECGTTAENVRGNLDKCRVLVVGVNRITRRLCDSLQQCGINRYEVIDYNLLRNFRFFDSQGGLSPAEWPSSLSQPLGDESCLEDMDPHDIGCLVAASDSGGQYYLRDWNRYCVENNILFLPVVLKNHVGFVGPMVAPGDTACLECLRLREDTNFNDPVSVRAGETEAYTGQIVNGLLPPMAAVLGDVAAMELIKFFSRRFPPKVGHLIQVNLLGPEMLTRKVLRAPRCPVCGPLMKTPSLSPLKLAFLPSNYQDYTHDK